MEKLGDAMKIPKVNGPDAQPLAPSRDCFGRTQDLDSRCRNGRILVFELPNRQQDPYARETPKTAAKVRA